MYNIEIQAKQPSESHTYKLLCLHSDDRGTNVEIRALTWHEKKAPTYSWPVLMTNSCSEYEMKLTVNKHTLTAEDEYYVSQLPFRSIGRKHFPKFQSGRASVKIGGQMSDSHWHCIS